MQNLKIAIQNKLEEFKKIHQETVEKYTQIINEFGLVSPQSIETLFNLNTINAMANAWLGVIQYIEAVEMNAAELPKL